MQVMTASEASSYMNFLGQKHCPFLFIIDFDLKKPLVLPLANIDPAILQYDFPGWSNADPVSFSLPESIEFSVSPIAFDQYLRAFELVQKHLQQGDSFLLNLTFPSRLTTNLSTEKIFHLTAAKYRLWWNGYFTCFSPEPFVQIRNGQISSFPMKGTIEADRADAGRQLLNNRKEKAEHATIVDLIRNDLSQVAGRVRVKRFRYLEMLRTHRGSIWQTSSEIQGNLPPDYGQSIGDLVFKLLPAGSISGAPKPKTVDIIRRAEQYERGYYTGIAGIFDGENLDSTVLIRFVEEEKNGLYFKSGGGITALSEVEEEYRELIRKVDLPLIDIPLTNKNGLNVFSAYSSLI